jgi:hypothetical protein
MPDPEDLRPLGTSPLTAWRVSKAEVDMTRPTASVRPVSVADGVRRLTFDLARTAIIVIEPFSKSDRRPAAGESRLRRISDFRQIWKQEGHVGFLGICRVLEPDLGMCGS